MMKLLAIASDGGHWEQLSIILKGISKDFEMCYVSTNGNCRHGLSGKDKFYVVRDFSRTSPHLILKSLISSVKIFLKEKPGAVITTGAAPGLVMVLVGWLFRKKTIWIDSMANVSRLSLSGRLILPFASRVYTQWKHLATTKIHFAGSVLKV
ncbi:MAG: UDP-N-acetylglucosamine transferase subunit ALG14 [Muribaculum sp.]|nr:UDP-N-acetylglucosamine transferase subunit ALG14 [Muribaculum sp.]